MSTVQLWVSGILAILRVLISQSTEEIVLSRVQELSFSPYLLSCPVIDKLRDGESAAAGPEELSEGRPAKSSPEETFSRCAPGPTLPTAVSRASKATCRGQRAQSGGFKEFTCCALVILFKVNFIGVTLSNKVVVCVLRRVLPTRTPVSLRPRALGPGDPLQRPLAGSSLSSVSRPPHFLSAASAASVLARLPHASPPLSEGSSCSWSAFSWRTS